MRLIEQVWTGDSGVDRAGRMALAPLEAMYRAAVVLRSEFYDRGIATVVQPTIPVVSVGNLTVGGTGKTPVSAWIAERLLKAGRAPAIVLRGYGGDEPLVHSRLNPGVPVVVAPNRSQGVREAASIGADIAVLDDGFQHRRAGRDLDLVLISADDWTGQVRMLPAGPFREPLSALRRASAVIVTRKAASDSQVEGVVKAVRSAGADATAVVRFELQDIVMEGPVGHRMSAAALADKRVLAVAAIGNPAAFFSQLTCLGANVEPLAFRDHHAFTASDIAMISARSSGFDYVVCTLKDAVKLRPVWPAGSAPLWYVSQTVTAERGAAIIDELLMRLRGRIPVT